MNGKEFSPTRSMTQILTVDDFNNEDKYALELYRRHGFEALTQHKFEARMMPISKPRQLEGTRNVQGKIDGLAYDLAWLKGSAFNVFEKDPGLPSPSALTSEKVLFEPVFRGRQIARMLPFFKIGRSSLPLEKHKMFGAKFDILTDEEKCGNCGCNSASTEYECLNCGLEPNGERLGNLKYANSFQSELQINNNYVEFFWKMIGNDIPRNEAAMSRNVSGLNAESWTDSAPCLRSWLVFMDEFCDNKISNYGVKGQEILGNMIWGLSGKSWRDRMLRQSLFQKSKGGRWGLASADRATFYKLPPSAGIGWKPNANDLLLDTTPVLAEFRQDGFSDSIVLGSHLLGEVLGGGNPILISNKTLVEWHKKMHDSAQFDWTGEKMLATVAFIQRYVWFMKESEVIFH